MKDLFNFIHECFLDLMEKIYLMQKTYQNIVSIVLCVLDRYQSLLPDAVEAVCQALLEGLQHLI